MHFVAGVTIAHPLCSFSLVGILFASPEPLRFFFNALIARSLLESFFFYAHHLLSRNATVFSSSSSESLASFNRFFFSSSFFSIG